MRPRILVFLLSFLLGSTALFNSASAQSAATYEAEVQLQDAPVAIACSATFPFVCVEPAPGNMAVAEVDFGTQFVSLETLCFTLRFEGDLLDPGEGFLIDVDPEPSGAGGAVNPGPAALSERTVCLASGFHDESLALFLDGEQTIHIFMTQGSATISEVEVVATGVAANVKPGKGCGDKNHVHQREGECKKGTR